MFMYSSDQLSVADVDKLFPSQVEDGSLRKATEALRSHMKEGFEAARGLGMPPAEALGHVLCWVAAEMALIGAGQKSGGASKPAPAWDPRV
jgi:hypothetical protein